MAVEAVLANRDRREQVAREDQRDSQLRCIMVHLSGISGIVGIIVIVVIILIIVIISSSSNNLLRARLRR